MQCRVSETLEKEGTNPCPSGLGVLFGSHNWCFDIGFFLSIFNQQIPASCPGVILHLQGTCSESFPEHLPFTFTPFQTPMLLFVKAQNPAGPLRCVPIKVHRLMPVTARHGPRGISHSVCLCSHHSCLLIPTHRCSYLLPLYFSQPLEDPAKVHLQEVFTGLAPDEGSLY